MDKLWRWLALALCTVALVAGAEPDKRDRVFYKPDQRAHRRKFEELNEKIEQLHDELNSRLPEYRAQPERYARRINSDAQCVKPPGIPEPIPNYGGWRSRARGQRVVGGSRADINDFPSYVGIKAMGWGPWETCGGVLISSNLVLTAAHCVIGKEKFQVAHSSVPPHLWNTNFVPRTKAIVACVPETFHNDVTLNHDWAVLVLEAPMRITREVWPACVSYMPVEPGALITLAGHGNSEYRFDAGGYDFTPVPTTELNRMQQEVLSCSPVDFHETKFCATGTPPRRQETFCPGDDGSGVYVNDQVGWILVGLASHRRGSSCNGMGESYNVYTATHAFALNIMDHAYRCLRRAASAYPYWLQKQKEVVIDPTRRLKDRADPSDAL